MNLKHFLSISSIIMLIIFITIGFVKLPQVEASDLKIPTIAHVYVEPAYISINPGVEKINSAKIQIEYSVDVDAWKATYGTDQAISISISLSLSGIPEEMDVNFNQNPVLMPIHREESRMVGYIESEMNINTENSIPLKTYEILITAKGTFNETEVFETSSLFYMNVETKIPAISMAEYMFIGIVGALAIIFALISKFGKINAKSIPSYD